MDRARSWARDPGAHRRSQPHRVPRLRGADRYPRGDPRRAPGPLPGAACASVPRSTRWCTPSTRAVRDRPLRRARRGRRATAHAHDCQLLEEPRMEAHGCPRLPRRAPFAAASSARGPRCGRDRDPAAPERAGRTGGRGAGDTRHVRARDDLPRRAHPLRGVPGKRPAGARADLGTGPRPVGHRPVARPLRPADPRLRR